MMRKTRDQAILNFLDDPFDVLVIELLLYYFWSLPFVETTNSRTDFRNIHEKLDNSITVPCLMEEKLEFMLRNENLSLSLAEERFIMHLLANKARKSSIITGHIGKENVYVFQDFFYVGDTFVDV